MIRLIEFAKFASRVFQFPLDRSDIFRRRQALWSLSADLNHSLADRMAHIVRRPLQPHLPLESFISDFGVRLRNAEEIRRQFFSAHEIQH